MAHTRWHPHRLVIQREMPMMKVDQPPSFIPQPVEVKASGKDGNLTFSILLLSSSSQVLSNGINLVFPR